MNATIYAVVRSHEYDGDTVLSLWSAQGLALGAIRKQYAEERKLFDWRMLDDGTIERTDQRVFVREYPLNPEG